MQETATAAVAVTEASGRFSATELANEFPIHVVCEWIGNSPDVARRHYLQVTEEHFQKATSNPTPSALVLAHQESSAEKETAVSPAIAKDTAVQIPPRGMLPACAWAGTLGQALR